MFRHCFSHPAFCRLRPVTYEAWRLKTQGMGRTVRLSGRGRWEKHASAALMAQALTCPAIIYQWTVELCPFLNNRYFTYSDWYWTTSDSPRLASASPTCWGSSWRIPCQCVSLLQLPPGKENGRLEYCLNILYSRSVTSGTRRQTLFLVVSQLSKKQKILTKTSKGQVVRWIPGGDRMSHLQVTSGLEWPTGVAGYICDATRDSNSNPHTIHLAN